MPAARSRCDHAIKRSKPPTVAGGGERNRDTSSVVSINTSDAASSIRSSRSLSVDEASTGKPAFQFVVSVMGAVRARLLVVERAGMLTPFTRAINRP